MSTQMIEVAMEDLADRGLDAALEEAESAKRAAKLAAECADEAAALVRDDVEMAAEWARCARSFANLALGHWTRSVRLAPGSAAARAAKDHAAIAAGHAHAAESAARRD